jgi:hypothetical protein
VTCRLAKTHRGFRSGYRDLSAPTLLWEDLTLISVSGNSCGIVEADAPLRPHHLHALAVVTEAIRWLRQKRQLTTSNSSCRAASEVVLGKLSAVCNTRLMVHGIVSWPRNSLA